MVRLRGQAIALVLVVAACAPGTPDAPLEPATVFVGATVVDGTGSAAIADAVLLVRAGRIEAMGPAEAVEVPDGAQTVDLDGRWITPGLINAHGHVGGTLGLEGGHYTTENILRQLGLYARYGVTTVVSLGGDGVEGIEVRDAEDTGLDRARLRLAGRVVAGESAEEVAGIVRDNAARGVDFVKIRVDDNLGTSRKMSSELFQTAIDTAHAVGLPLAAHLFYLDDAKALLRAGADFLAHSVRDQPVDDELIGLLLEAGVCLSPTLTREISTFVYESEPGFFSDEFFLAEADPAVLDALRDPESQARYRDSPAAAAYEEALAVAMANVGALSDAGVRLAFGTDSGPPARFQGYFEHYEMLLMEQSGLTPEQVLAAATRDAAACVGLDDLGTLEPGKWADFVVLGADPLSEMINFRAIEAVYIAGNRVPGRGR